MENIWNLSCSRGNTFVVCEVKIMICILISLPPCNTQPEKCELLRMLQPVSHSPERIFIAKI